MSDLQGSAVVSEQTPDSHTLQVSQQITAIKAAVARRRRIHSRVEQTLANELLNRMLESQIDNVLPLQSFPAQQ